MQRWILYVGISLVGLTLLVGAGLYGYREFLRSKPAPVWAPIALRADVSMKDQSKLAEEIEKKLRADGRLRQVVKDLKLGGKFGSVDENAAVKELDRRLFVDVGMMDQPAGRVPSINVGVRGVGRESEFLNEIVTRLIQDILKILGIDPETGKPLEGVEESSDADF